MLEAVGSSAGSKGTLIKMLACFSDYNCGAYFCVQDGGTDTRPFKQHIQSHDHQRHQPEQTSRKRLPHESSAVWTRCAQQHCIWAWHQRHHCRPPGQTQHAVCLRQHDQSSVHSRAPVLPALLTHLLWNYYVPELVKAYSGLSHTVTPMSLTCGQRPAKATVLSTIASLTASTAVAPWARMGNK